MKLKLTAFPLLLLAACSGETPPPTTALSDLPEFTIRATGDIETPLTMTDAAFVPNSVATWLSQIIMISDEGDIWRTNSDGEPPLLISKGDYKDIRGLTREDGPGVFLAVQPDGRASAFVERDDIGNFKPMAVSQGAFGISTFCNGSGDPVAFIDTEGHIQTLSRNIIDDVTLELGAAKLPPVPAVPVSCSYNSAGDIFVTSQSKNKLHTFTLENEAWKSFEGDITSRNLTWLTVEDLELILGLSPESSTMAWLAGHNGLQVNIDDGLSIRGLEDIQFVAGTDAPMGSVYNDGLILMGDANDNRVVLLSLDYVRRALEIRE